MKFQSCFKTGAMLVILFLSSGSLLSAQGAKLGIQGILKKGDGTSVTDGNYALTFRIYNVAEGGTALWTETQSSVPVNSGLYNAVLGSVTALNLSFSEDYFVGVSVGSTPEMAPRLQLSTAPYALSVRGSTNTFPNTGSVGVGTTSPASGYQLHLGNTAGNSYQLLEGSTGAGLTFIKGSVQATAGIGSSDNILRFNPGVNSLVFQHNSTDVAEVNNNGISVAGTGSFSNGLTVSSGTLTLGNISFSGSSIDCTADMDMKFGTSTKLTVNSEGVTMPGHLAVTGSWSYYNSGKVAFYAREGVINCQHTGCNGAGSTTSASINSTNRVRAFEFNSYSDQRIKRDIILSDAKLDMEIMRRLQVANYRHKDVVEKGTDFKKGFIAQEVEEVFPEAVTITPNFIPDVYQLAVSAAPEENNLLVTLSQPHELKAGDKVRVINPQGQRDYMVCTVPDDRHFSIAGWDTETPEWLFVYGRQVDDFRQVDYDRIHTLNVSVTQELIRSMEALESEIAELKNENIKLKERRDRLDARVSKLEAAVSN
jgi:hypothetical protein